MIELSPKTFEEFQREMANGNVVPVVRSVLADLQTPVSAFLRVSHAAKSAFLLESVEGGERLARFSFIGANPYKVVRGKGSETIVESGENTEILENTKFLDYLREHFKEKKLARRANLPPLCGGAVGYFGYDAVRWFEPVLDDDKEPETDSAVLMFFRNILAFDRLRQRIEIVSVVFTDEAEGDEKKLRELYEKAVAETAKIEKLVSLEFLPPPLPEKSENPTEEGNIFLSNITRQKFIQSVEKIKEYIFAGDAYQVVFSQRFRRQINVDPLQVYRALRTINPSPYMFLLKIGNESLVGASPEMLVRCRGKRLDYRPIAGTQPRGATEAEDWMLGEEMRTDEKEVAEHTMLVDLGRNDLGRIAEYGSVEVDELMTIEKYSHVQHLVTSLRARLRDGLDRFDALASCFPAGTVSGAPKVRAMQIINELEPTNRGVYAGAVGYIDYAENLDTCIAIRTVHIKDGWASLQAGGGIVADSVPEKEYEESVNKARAVVRAIEMAENGL